MSPTVENSPECGPWWRQAVIYQVYPRSFADASGDGVGDLRGVIGRLDHLEWLGVDAIWLSPVFRSPMADFGYDISDHCDIDPLFGTLADADELIDDAHRRGMKVVFDIVLPHTSDQHRWFQQARTGRDDPYRDFYVWRDGPTPGSAVGGPPNNWEAGFPSGAIAWTFEERTGQWYLHSHLPEQPDLNWDNPAVADAQEQVLRFWLDRGVDGVRLDSVNRLGKDPALRDNVVGRPPRQQDWPSVHPLLRRVRRVLEEYPGRLAVGEVWVFDQRQLSPYLADDELHLAHNFVFARTGFSADEVVRIVREFRELVAAPERAAWFFSNHDEPRVRSRFDFGDGHGPARAELLAVLLLTLQGTVFLYQGEELGLGDTPVPSELQTDGDGRDPQRTPLPWTSPGVSGPGAGFSEVEPWLPVGDDAEARNVDAERADPNSTLHLYRRLVRLRRSAAPATAAQTVALLTDDVMALQQETTAGTRVALLNFATTARPVPAAALPRLENGRLLLSTDRTRRCLATGTAPLELGPLEGLIVEFGRA